MRCVDSIYWWGNSDGFVEVVGIVEIDLAVVDVVEVSENVEVVVVEWWWRWLPGERWQTRIELQGERTTNPKYWFQTTRSGLVPSCVDSLVYLCICIHRRVCRQIDFCCWY